MALYLVQHGKCLSKEQDPEQSLSQVGIEEVNRICSHMAAHAVDVGSIEHSVKKRARQTAEYLAAALKPKNGILEKQGLKPMDDVAFMARDMGVEENRMLVGHLPFMEKMVSFLVTGTLDPAIFKFRNGGVVCLDQLPEKKSWYIRWAVVPEIV